MVKNCVVFTKEEIETIKDNLNHIQNIFTEIEKGEIPPTKNVFDFLNNDIKNISTLLVEEE